MAEIKVKLYGDKGAYAWQKEVHDYVSRWLASGDRAAETVVVKAARQRYGKSTFTKAELIRFALECPGSVNAYIAPDLRLSRKMFREIARGCKALISSANGQTLEIEFRNGSLIRLHSEGQGEGLRGYTVSGVLVIDEAASQKDSTFYELVSPWVSVNKALTIIISTGKFKVGFFYDLFMEGTDPGKPYYTTFDWVGDYEVPIPPEDVAKRDKMPAMKWKSEYLGLFLDASGSVFGDFSRLFIDGRPGYKELYLGLDFGTGSGKDYTVLSALNERREQVFVWAVNDLSPTEQVTEIARICRDLDRVEEKNGKQVRISPVKEFYVEQNGIGKVYLSGLRETGLSVTPFTTTNESKRRLVEKLQVAFEREEIKLQKDAEQTAELSFYESKVNKTTNTVTYNAPAGMHDDRVMALMLSNEAYQAGKQRAFHLGFV